MDPSNLRCQEVGSVEYRKLCQTLSLPPGQGVARSFTGLPSTDLIILSELDDSELINVCATNKYLNGLCNNESFWLRRTVDKFGNVLGTTREIHDQYIPQGTTWKEYYLWLSGLVSGDRLVLDMMATTTGRGDLMSFATQRTITAPGLSMMTQPFEVQQPLLGFLKEADFGPSDVNNPYSVPLKEYMSVLTTGVSNMANLTILLPLYFLLQTDSRIPQFTYKVTPLFKKYFGSVTPIDDTVNIADMRRIIEFRQGPNVTDPEIYQRLTEENFYFRQIFRKSSKKQ